MKHRWSWSSIRRNRWIDTLYGIRRAAPAAVINAGRYERPLWEERVKLHPFRHLPRILEVQKMAQKVTGLIKLQIPAGKATPAPPVGPALGQHGVNIMAFTKEFNERTKNDAGLIIPVVITVYADRSFTFVTKTPPAAVLIKKACGIESGSGAPNKTKVAKITREQVKKDCRTENARPQRCFRRICHEHDRWHCTQHGHRSRRLITRVGGTNPILPLNREENQ